MPEWTHCVCETAGMLHFIAGLNILLGLAGFLWLMKRTTARWREYPREVQANYALSLMLFFGLLTTSVEMFVRHLSAASTISIIFVVKIAALVVLYRTRHTLYRTSPRDRSSSDSRNVNRDVERDIS